MVLKKQCTLYNLKHNNESYHLFLWLQRWETLGRIDCSFHTELWSCRQFPNYRSTLCIYILGSHLFFLSAKYNNLIYSIPLLLYQKKYNHPINFMRNKLSKSVFTLTVAHFIIFLKILSWSPILINNEINWGALGQSFLDFKQTRHMSSMFAYYYIVFLQTIIDNNIRLLFSVSAITYYYVLQLLTFGLWQR